MSRRTKPFDVPSFRESMQRAYESGEISLENAAIEFHNAGYTTSVDIEYARNRLETPFRYLSANYATGFNETETDSRSAGWTFDEPDVFDGDF